MDSSLNFAPCGYISFKDDGIIISVNHTLSSWLGYGDDELIGKKIENILTLSSRIFYQTHFFPLVKLNSNAEEIFFSLCTKNKNDIPVMAQAERRLENEMYKIHCIFVQVHQRKKYEEEILNAKRAAEIALEENKQLEELRVSLENRSLELDKQYQKQLAVNQDLLQFSKIISHDLQEPLRKIQLFTEFIWTEEKDKLTEKSKSAIQKINIASNRLRMLTKGLQQFVSTDEEKVYTDVDLNKTIEIAKEKGAGHHKFYDFDLVYETLPVIEGYKMQLELLFFNLIDNSIKFREPSRKLKITISGVILEENVYRIAKNRYRFSEHIKIIYTDNGIGFDQEYKEYVFELLKKIDPVTEGLGMGLSLVKKIIDNHTGLVNVKSEKGKGAKFVMIFPVKRG